MRAVAVLAIKELQDGLRNRWVISIIILLGSFALLLLLLSSAPNGTVKVSPLSIGVVNLSSLSVYLLPLIALMLAFDALVGEFERGTMLLLLTYPVTRWQIVVGKFSGHLFILMLALVLGYGGAALISIWHSGSSVGWENYLSMMLSSLLLGSLFLLIGYLISAIASERSVAIAIAIACWLCFVVLYDLALLGVLLAADEQLITTEVFKLLMLVNPTDLYRMFNLSIMADSIGVNHIAGSINAQQVTLTELIVSFFMWFVSLLSLVIWVFQRREV